MSDTSTASTPKIEVRISDDELSAAVFIDPGDADAIVTAEQLLDALRESKVHVSPQIEASAQKLAQVYNERKRLPSEIVLVRGSPAVDAVHESVQWSQQLNATLADWQAGATDGSYSQEALFVVPASEIFGTVLPSRPPVNGVTVKGEQLMGRGFAKSLLLDKTIIRDESTSPASLSSTQTGRVVLDGIKLRVEEALQIEQDVGPATGNIDSDAHVFVCGSIPDRYEVAATKSVVVGGSIEAANVRAGTDVLVKLGIVGRGQGTVVAGKDIVAKFCSQADLSLGGNLKVAAQLMSCNLLAEGSLIAEEALLVGGLAWFRYGGAIDTLGSDACIDTRIFVDEDPDIIKAQAVEEARRRREGEASGDVRQNDDRSGSAGDESASSRPEGTLGLFVKSIIYPKTRVSVNMRVFTFENELKGPVLLTTKKVRNATELVAIHQKTDHVQKLRSQTLSAAELAKEFKPLSEIRAVLQAQTRLDSDQPADDGSQA